ncbi:hypothetical protein GIB67_025764, partial [Kingdonia uniflora]
MIIKLRFYYTCHRGLFLERKIPHCWRSAVVKWGQYRCSKSGVVKKWSLRFVLLNVRFTI